MPTSDPLSHRTGRRAPWQAGVDAAWANRWPGLGLSLFAVTLLLTYWFVPAVQDFFDQVAAWKDTIGLPFAVVSTGLFGGAVPWLVQRLRPTRLPGGQGVRRVPVSHLVFLAAFWGYKGIEVDLFYRAQAWWLGTGTDAATVTGKVLIDMAIYCTFWAVPMTVWGYLLKDRFLDGDDGGSPLFDPAVPTLTGRLVASYRRDVVPVLISNWAVWIPAVCVIYLLPLPLQLPMQNLVLCFWALLLIWQVRISGSDVRP